MACRHNTLFYSVVLLIAFHSCSRPIAAIEGQILEIISYSEQREKPVTVLMGDYRSINKWCNSRQFLNKYYPNSDSLFYIDLSLKENRNLAYVFQFESLPALLLVDSLGSFNRVIYLSEESSPHDITFSEEEKRYLMDMTLISSGHKEKIQSSYPDDFLYNYLMAVSFTEKDDRALFYAKKAFEVNREGDIYSALYDDLTLRFQPYAVLASQGDIIRLPDLKINETAQVSFNLSNIGDVPLIISSVAVSCSCVSVEYPQRIPGHTNAPLIVRYVAGDIPGPVDQNITVKLNTEQKIHRFRIKGLVIK